MKATTAVVVAVAASVVVFGADKTIDFGRQGVNAVREADTQRDPGDLARAVTENAAGEQAKAQLVKLTVNNSRGATSYNRDDWRHWSDLDGDGCDTRAEVLAPAYKREKHDGCKVLPSGTFTDPYERTTTKNLDPHTLDIDHLVSLGDAARSGGYAWDAKRKEQYANDLRNLVATRAALNRSKGDKGPADWQPPAAAARCTYAITYVQTKYRYKLTVTSRDKAALERLLETC